MYKIDPSRWWCDHDGTVLYDKGTVHQWFNFSPIGFLKYHLFLWNRDREKVSFKNNKQWEKIIEAWQDDINKYREKYTKELQDKIKEI